MLLLAVMTGIFSCTRAVGQYAKLVTGCSTPTVASGHVYSVNISLDNALSLKNCCTDRVRGSGVRVCYTSAHAVMTYKIFRSCIVVFARLPVPGKAKTRLADSVGDEAAAEFYKLCAEQTFHSTYRLAPAFTVCHKNAGWWVAVYRCHSQYMQHLSSAVVTGAAAAAAHGIHALLPHNPNDLMQLHLESIFNQYTSART